AECLPLPAAPAAAQIVSRPSFPVIWGAGCSSARSRGGLNGGSAVRAATLAHEDARDGCGRHRDRVPRGHGVRARVRRLE
ncbi:hypothetical protein MNEG_16625, partial [Monoraphidium neglectum]